MLSRYFLTSYDVVEAVRICFTGLWRFFFFSSFYFTYLVFYFASIGYLLLSLVCLWCMFFFFSWNPPFPFGVPLGFNDWCVSLVFVNYFFYVALVYFFFTH